MKTIASVIRDIDEIEKNAKDSRSRIHAIKDRIAYFMQHKLKETMTVAKQENRYKFVFENVKDEITANLSKFEECESKIESMNYLLRIDDAIPIVIKKIGTPTAENVLGELVNFHEMISEIFTNIPTAEETFNKAVKDTSRIPTGLHAICRTYRDTAGGTKQLKLPDGIVIKDWDIGMNIFFISDAMKLYELKIKTYEWESTKDLAAISIEARRNGLCWTLMQIGEMNLFSRDEKGLHLTHPNIGIRQMVGYIGMRGKKETVDLKLFLMSYIMHEFPGKGY